MSGPGSVTVGRRLPELVRTLELVDLVTYGAATWDWHGLHYDSEMAAALGFDRPVVDGQMLGALLAEQVVAFAGPAGRLTRLHFRNRAPVLCGATVVCQGEVVAVSANGFVVEQEVVVDGQVVVGPAGAEVQLDRPSFNG